MAAPGGLDRGPDAAIKLFGHTIPLLDSSSAIAAAPEVCTELANGDGSNDAIPSLPGIDKISNVDASSYCPKDNKNGLQAISSKHGKMDADSKPEDVKTESDGSGEEKAIKKPNTILPCPRCNSMETKFCYFNNYNVKQPRHFCRDCRRYWTAGGNMRNVPVGAGRRKNKRPSQHRRATKPHDHTIAANGDTADAIHHQSPAVKLPVFPGPAKENEKITESGSEVMFSESISPVFNAKEQNNIDPVSLASDDKEEISCASTAAVSGCSENGMPQNTVTMESNGISELANDMKEAHPQSQSYPVVPSLVFPWTPGWNSVAGMASNQSTADGNHSSQNGNVSLLSLLPPPMMPDPRICAPAVPFPLVPPFWSCIPGWPNGAWSSAWPGSSGTALPFPPANGISSSTMLGKHPRDANSEVQQAEKTLWAPKTLRIDNPDEAAKSSIWASLGIKPDERIIFKSSQLKDLQTDKTQESPQALLANPAAFSRSQTFQERT